MADFQNALIVFLKFPDPGRVKTRLAESIGDEAAADVYRRLTEQTVATLCCGSASEFQTHLFFDPPEQEQSVREWLHVSASGCLFHPQADGDLGVRMREAFHQLFTFTTAKKAVIIGTDCPQLDQELLNDAFRALDDFPVVIGPAVDGGYYLLGMREEFPFVFENVSWSTGQVLAQTLSNLDKLQIPHHELPTLRDIDTIQDLNAVWPAWSQTIQEDRQVPDLT